MPYQTRRARARESAHFERVRRAEGYYGARLRAVARHIGEIISSFRIGDPALIPELQSVLSRYADVIRPWAQSTAARMIAEVARRDETAWFRSSRELGRNLRAEIRETPIGDEVRRILESQVELITSLPIEAGRRVQLLTQEYATGGRRFAELVPLVQQSGRVTVSRATLISRTEVAKAASAIVQARARYVGAESYIWHTVRDRDVRRLHRRLEGTVHRWDDPPVAEEQGQRHHPGDFPNCRCYAEPIIPDIIT